MASRGGLDRGVLENEEGRGKGCSSWSQLCLPSRETGPQGHSPPRDRLPRPPPVSLKPLGTVTAPAGLVQEAVARREQDD